MGFGVCVTAGVRGGVAVAPAPARRQPELVRVRRHRCHVGKALSIDERRARLVVEAQATLGRRALLPVVVQPHVAVAEVAERGRHAVYFAVLADHAVHDPLDERLVDVGAERVP